MYTIETKIKYIYIVKQKLTLHELEFACIVNSLLLLYGYKY